jgi:clan AA aspartic protease (TIGR02281 family)
MRRDLGIFLQPVRRHAPEIIGLLCLILILLLCTSVWAQSGFYRYVDKNGQVRYTDNPANIPPEQYQEQTSEVPFDGFAVEPAGAASDVSGAQRIVINYDADRGSILVNGLLNRRYPVLFLVDTGATRTMITEADVRMLGLAVDSTRRVSGLIADGSIVEMPVVRLVSVEVGEARVSDIEVAVGRMRLLGMDFLGAFDMNVNAQAGQLVLVPKAVDPTLRAAQREPESIRVRQDREQAKRDIDNQIAQFTLAMKTRTGTIQQFRDDISEAEAHRTQAEAALSALHDRGRFEGSGVSRDENRAAAIGRMEKNINDINAYIQNCNDNIALQEKQIAGMQERINHLRALRRRIN